MSRTFHSEEYYTLYKEYKKNWQHGSVLYDLDVTLPIRSAITMLMTLCHGTAVDKGWWEPQPEGKRTFGECISLMHSELSEALEEYRAIEDGLYQDSPEVLRYEKPGSLSEGDVSKPEGIAAELADVIIRILDTCAYWGIPIGTALIDKMKYNETRAHRHGGKRI